MGWLASFKGHAFHLEVTFCRQVVDGLQVEAVGELECVLIWQLDDLWSKEMHSSVTLPGWKGKADSHCSVPWAPPTLLLHTIVLVSPCISKRRLKCRHRSLLSLPRFSTKLLVLGPPRPALWGPPQVGDSGCWWPDHKPWLRGQEDGPWMLCPSKS